MLLLFLTKIMYQNLIHKSIQVLFLITIYHFELQTKMILNKVNKIIEIIRELHNILPRSAQFTIYKTFFIPHLYYNKIIYGQAYDPTLYQKSKLTQFCIKVVLSPSKKLFYFLQSKMMKNTFYFISKAFFVLKVFDFFS